MQVSRADEDVIATVTESPLDITESNDQREFDISLSLGEINFTEELHSPDYQDHSTCLEDLGLDGHSTCLEDLDLDGHSTCLEDLGLDGHSTCLEDLDLDGHSTCLEDLGLDGHSTCLEDLGLDGIDDNDFSDFSEDSFDRNMDEFDKLCQEVVAANTLHEIEPLRCSICGIQLKPG